MKPLALQAASLRLALCALLACAWGAAKGPAQPRAAGRIVLGYYAGDTETVYRSVTTFRSYLNAIAVARFGVGADGAVTGSLPNRRLLPFGRAHGMRTYACAGNFGSDGGFDGALAHGILVDKRTAAVDNLVKLTVAGRYDGLNLDFESMRPSDRAAYSRFVIDLASRLHAKGLKLVLSVPAVTRDDPADEWAGAFDYKVIGRHADLLQLMAYDEHGPAWSGPGPVAGRAWVEQCVAYACTVVSPARLILGLPAYGYDWDLTAFAETGAYPASYVPWTDFPALLAIPGAVRHRDEGSLAPFVTYARDGHDHEAWLEDAVSIASRTALVRKFKLGGISVWALGQEDLSYWKAALAGLK